MSRPFRRLLAPFTLCLLIDLSGVAGAAQPLTLGEAEALALAADPGSASLAAKAEGLRERAVADSQLPDPQVKLGFLNFPTDTFSRTQEPMTQIAVGAKQMFPRGRSLALQGERTRALSAAEEAQADARRRDVVRQVRRSYLDLYLQRRSVDIVRENRALFQQLVQVTERHYAAGRQNQQDVIRAQLELARLDDREQAILAQEEVAGAELARWVGRHHLARFVPEIFPELPPLADLETLQARVEEHPLMRADLARIEASRKGVEIAREAYKPSWGLDVLYGFRDGENLDGSPRADFLTAMVSMDVPVFTNKRQDRRLAASQQETSAALLSRDDRLGQLREKLQADYARWKRTGDRLVLYRDTLLAQARQNSQASLKAYQSDVASFNTLMRAQIMELQTQLDALKLGVDRAIAQANILYLAEKTP